MRRLAIIGIVSGVCACASSVPEVRVTGDPRVTAACAYLGVVSSVDSWGEEDMVRKLSADVHALGGDTLLLSPGTGNPGLVTHGEAFRCGRHAGTPIPPPSGSSGSDRRKASGSTEAEPAR